MTIGLCTEREILITADLRGPMISNLFSQPLAERLEHDLGVGFMEYFVKHRGEGDEFYLLASANCERLTGAIAGDGVVFAMH